MLKFKAEWSIKGLHSLKAEMNLGSQNRLGENISNWKHSNSPVIIRIRFLTVHTEISFLAIHSFNVALLWKTSLGFVIFRSDLFNSIFSFAYGQLSKMTIQHISVCHLPTHSTAGTVFMSCSIIKCDCSSPYIYHSKTRAWTKKGYY